MDTVETVIPAPSKFWQYVLVGTLGLIIRVVGQGLMHAGWGRWANRIAAAISMALIFTVAEDTWREKLKTFIGMSLAIIYGHLAIYIVAPFLSNYIHLMIAYALSAFPLALIAIFYRNWQRGVQPLSEKGFFRELGFGLAFCCVFGLIFWLLNLIFHS